MKQLTFFENRDVYAEWHELLEPYVKGISAICYLCPMERLCKGGCCGDGTITHGSEEKLEQVMKYIIDNYDFDEYYKKWKLDMLHRHIKSTRRHNWKWNNYHNDKHAPKVNGQMNDETIRWHKHWLDSLEQIEKEQRWNWTLEEEWTDYKKWRKEQK